MVGVPKVTWLNRKQEEADPYFQRQQPVPYFAMGNQFQQKHQQPLQYYGQYDTQYYNQQTYYQSDGGRPVTRSGVAS